MSENQKDLSKSLNSPLMNVIDDGMLGLKTTEIQTKMQAGVGKPDSNDATSGVSVAYRLSLSAGHGTAVGGLRNYLSADVGSGYWDFIGVCPGVMLSITDAIYHTSHRMKLPAERLVKIRVVCSGSIYLAHDALRVVDGSTVIQHFAGGKPAEYVIEANESPLQMVVLHVLPEAMQNLGLTADVLPKKLISVFGLAEAADSVFNVQASAKLVRIAREVLESRDHLLGEMRQTYVRGKAYELLCEAVLRSGPVTDTLAGGNRFRRSDIMRLHEARRILGSDLESSPTIEKLSCLVGINRTKLQAGFREFFGET
ncbi:MAG: helix-turn-helix transcriptional regulator, partial [Gammaproteobacteria bacterium]|nr:helix-turn-helix transcriptional regulator [Gammaproteobacteria bacterium]